MDILGLSSLRPTELAKCGVEYAHASFTIVTRRTSVQLLEDLLKPDSETHTRWMQELDLMAAGLKELQEAGVVVLWRPFHEMNGGWFWWGAAEPEKFIAVWRHMFDYFSKTKGLNNLLWVYGPNHGQNTASYYAGEQYVDIVGLDAYTDYLDPQHVKGYAEVAALPKPRMLAAMFNSIEPMAGCSGGTSGKSRVMS